MHLAKRLVDFITLLLLKGIASEDAAEFAENHLFDYSERNTVIHCYGPYEEIAERHPEKDLVIKFMSDGGTKVHASWQGVSITVEGNFPDMGWDSDDGEFGLGGDWWKGE